MKMECFKVRMFGAFEIQYGEKVLSFERNNATKTNQLLQIVLLAGQEGISRAELMDTLFGREEVTNPATSLRTTVFRLRKLLEKEISGSDFIVIKNGTYNWDFAIPTQVDVTLFEEKAQAAFEETNRGQRVAMLWEACQMYTGQFLNELEDIEWVKNAHARYQKIYYACLDELISYYVEVKEYEKLEALLKQAIELYPFDEWQLPYIDCLVAMGKEKEAVKLYHDTEELYFNELGKRPSEKMKELFSRIEEAEESTDRIFSIQALMEQEDDLDGAYYCSYPSFEEMYRYIRRILERSGQNAYLMQVTITDGKGQPLEREERTNKLGDELKEAIQGALRKGDLFTQYRPNIYLIVLIRIDKKDIANVIDRINSKFEKASRKNYLKYSYAPL